MPGSPFDPIGYFSNKDNGLLLSDAHGLNLTNVVGNPIVPTVDAQKQQPQTSIFLFSFGVSLGSYGMHAQYCFA